MPQGCCFSPRKQTGLQLASSWTRDGGSGKKLARDDRLVAADDQRRTGSHDGEVVFRWRHIFRWRRIGLGRRRIFDIGRHRLLRLVRRRDGHIRRSIGVRLEGRGDGDIRRIISVGLGIGVGCVAGDNQDLGLGLGRHAGADIAIGAAEIAFLANVAGESRCGNGKCFSFDTAIKVNSFYYRAESKPYKEGRNTVTTSWGNEKTFAIFEDANLQYWGADRKVLNSSLAKFSKGAKTDGPVTATVTFEADGKFTTVKIPPTPTGGAN